MAFTGFQLIKTNASNNVATTIADNGPVTFTNTNLYPTADEIITYSDETTPGTFSFTEANSFFVNWTVNLQSAQSTDAKFKLVVTTPGTPDADIKEYASSSIFKTGQMTGSALIKVESTSTMQLINDSGTSVTLAIGPNIITAGISIFTVSGISDYTGAAAYINNTVDTVASDAIIPFNLVGTPAAGDGIAIDTTGETTKGTVTITKSGTYTLDWTLALSGAPEATEVVIQVIDNATPTPVVLATHYSPVVSKSFVSGTSIITVSHAQAETAGGYKFALYNKTTKVVLNGETEETQGVQLDLALITQRGSIRVTGAN